MGQCTERLKRQIIKTFQSHSDSLTNEHFIDFYRYGKTMKKNIFITVIVVGTAVVFKPRSYLSNAQINSLNLTNCHHTPGNIATD
jgi:hypothetical protein